MTTKCPTSANPPEQPTTPPKVASPLRAKIRKFYDGLRSIAGIVTDTQAFEAELAEKFTLLATSAAQVRHLTNYNKLESTMSWLLGWKAYFWKASSLQKTEAGQIADLLLSKAKEAYNMVDLLATYKSLPTIRNMWRELQVNLPNVSNLELQAILHDHIVIGQFPKLTNIYDSPVVRAELALRYQKHTEKLVNLGLTPDNIGKLDELAGEMSGYFDNARILVGKYGLDVKALQNGGYFPLQATDNVKRILEKQQEDLFTNSAQAKYKSANLLNRSRASYIPVVADLSKAAERFGLTEAELALMLGEPGQFAEYLYKRFSLQQIENMFDNGTLAQIPALSDELVHFFNKSLDLPVDNMAEAIIADPIKAMENYNAQLKAAVENSAMVQVALEEGVKNGWVLDDIELKSLPLDQQKNFMKIGSNKLMADLFGETTNLRESIADGWIHKTVADQLRAHFSINTSFEQLGLMASGLRWTIKATGWFKRQALLAASIPTLQYPKRVFFQNFTSLYAATGGEGTLKLAPALLDVGKFFKSKSFESFSDVKKYTVAGKEVSDRELFFTTFIRTAGNFASTAGESVEYSKAWARAAEKLHPESLQQFWKYSKVFNERYGSPFTGQILDNVGLVAEMFNAVTREPYEQLARFNQFVDFATRWAAVKDLAANPSHAGKQQWQSLEELISYTNEYFNINENSGKVGKVAGQVFVPFASFALVAPGATARHALRHPWRYARLMYLYSQAQHAQGRELTDAEVSQWQKDTYTIFVGKGTDGKLWSVNPGSVDYSLDVTQWAKENFERTARSFGLEAGSTQEILDSKLDPTADVNKTALDIFGKVYFSRPALALLAGVDSRTREKISDIDKDTMIGVEMPKRWVVALRDTAPLLRVLDRYLPASIVGSPGSADAFGMQTEAPTASWSGAVPSTGGNRPEAIPDLRKPEQITAWVLSTGGGLTLSQLDPGRQLIRTDADFKTRIEEINKVLADVDTKLMQAERPDRRQLEELRLRMQQMKGAFEFQRILVKKIALEKGYPYPEAIDYVRQTIREARDVPNESLLEYLRTRGN